MKHLPLVLAAGAALAPAAVAAADLDQGRQLAYTCTGCHGIPGQKNVYPHYHVPKIAGQTMEYLVVALNAYRTGERAHPTMQAQGEGLTVAEIEQVAAYLASLAPEASR
jgi:cytochrome c553